jgi:signal transduction histidine kinase
MKIRTKLTAWYAGIMFVSLLTIAVLVYHEFAPASYPGSEAASKSGERDDKDESDFEKLLQIFLWCGVPPALFALAGGWWLTRKTLKPIEALTAAAEKVHDQNLHERLSRSGNGDELDRLTEVFNAMTTRLDSSFQHIREFALHASHELKTPLTILHGEIETELRGETLSAAQRDKLASQLDEIQRLAKIVDGLTLLTKADAGQITLKCEPVAFDELVREVFEDTLILARHAAISVELAACEKTTISGDKHRLRQLLLNLADNAVKYNRVGGTIEFFLRRAGKDVELQITNTGTEIPPEILPRIFERFYRGDAAHNSSIEGCGLGLSIAQWIVSSHKGAIKIESSPVGKTAVTVKLPAS